MRQALLYPIPDPPCLCLPVAGMTGMTTSPRLCYAKSRAEGFMNARQAFYHLGFVSNTKNLSWKLVFTVRDPGVIDQVLLQ